jgi:phage/plasmid-like protein (TIGR03299 family)
MAHEIDFSNNRSNLAFVGEVPWHGLGTELQPGAPIEVWCQQAGLDFEVNKAPAKYDAYRENGVPETSLFNNRHILYRSDTLAPLSVVSSNRFHLVQPRQVIEFFRDLVGVGGMELEVAGSLLGGLKVWALARTNREIRIMGQDLVKSYLLLTTGYEAGSPTYAMFTSIRVVCNNTLNMSINGKEGRIVIPHFVQFDEAKVKEDLGLVDKAADQFEENAARMAKRKVFRKEAVQFLVDVLGDKDKPAEEQQEYAARQIKAVMDLFEGKGRGSNLKSADGTAWGLVNAVTQFVDYEKRSRSPDSRINSAWFGDGANLKKKAVQAALALAA